MSAQEMKTRFKRQNESPKAHATILLVEFTDCAI